MKITLKILSIFLVSTLVSAETHNLSRYVIEEREDIPGPMGERVRIEFPAEVKTLQQAIDYVMWPTGYAPIMDSSTSLLFARFKVPDSHRSLGPDSTLGIVRTLTGQGRAITINHTFRLVNIEVGRDISDEETGVAMNAWDSYAERSQSIVALYRAVPLNHTEYLVKKGDSVSRIGMDRGVTKARMKSFIRDVVQLNPHAFVDGDANRLHARAALTLPALEAYL